MSKQFSNQDLKKLIVPLFLEQLLVALVGMADVFVIGFVGEAAVSGVSLVNSFNTIHNVFNTVAFPFADPLGKGLRACGDVGFTTGISLFTTIGVRLVFSMLFAVVLKMGVIGIAFAMCLDWSMRGIIFWFRFKQGKWKTLKVI